MAAQLEEIVMPADPLEPERLGPDPGQAGLDLAGRRFIAARRIGRTVRGRQRLAVELAVRGERQGVEPHIGRRQHVVGQGCREVPAQRLGAGCFRIRRHGVIGHQPLVAAVFAGERHRLAHRRMLRQPGLDLAQLDPEAADLHLEVVAAQKLDGAVRQIAAKIAGLVHPRIGLLGKRVRHEPLRRQLRSVQIAAGDPSPANVDLPSCPNRNRLAVPVQDIYPRVRYRSAKRNAGRWCVRANVPIKCGRV